MIYSIFFCAGIVTGCALWSAAWYFAKRIAETGYKTQINKLRQDGLMHRQNLEEAVKSITNAYGGNGTQLTTRHKEVLAEELSQVLTKRPPANR